VAGHTERGILPAETIGIEPGAVRAEPEPAADRRVACRAVPLSVTGDARLEVLPRSLTMTQEEGRPSVVEARAAQSTRHPEAGLLVTPLTKLGGVVTVAAGRVAIVGGRRMPGQEAGRMEA